MAYNFILVLSFKCMLNAMSYASSVDIVDSTYKLSVSRPAPQAHLKTYLKALLRHQERPDPRILALSWVESRIRPKVKRGDRGRACGIYQIHARYSYPYLRRKRGFAGWKEVNEHKAISRECARLENINYSVDSMIKLLKKMDARHLHPCHHNSGFYGKCNPWYKKRLNYWILYFSVQTALCKLPQKAFK